MEILFHNKNVMKNNSERPVDAIAEKHQWLTDWLTTWNQEMLAPLKNDKEREGLPLVEEYGLDVNPGSLTRWILIEEKILHPPSFLVHLRNP